MEADIMFSESGGEPMMRHDITQTPDLTFAQWLEASMAPSDKRIKGL